MGIETRQLQVAKEIDDVMLLFPEIIRQIRAGKSLMDLASSEFSNLVTAVQGIDQVPEELKADRKVALQTIGYRTGEIADAFL